jgi:opacity protein-like surface antigen
MKPMKALTISVMAAALLASGASAAAKDSPARQGELILYQDTNFNVDNYTVDRDNTFIHTDWNIRSIALYPGEKWQICNKPRFQGDCLILTDNLPDAATMGINGQVPSARRVVDKH